METIGKVFKFTFQSFWHFIGVLILINILFDGLHSLITGKDLDPVLEISCNQNQTDTKKEVPKMTSDLKSLNVRLFKLQTVKKDLVNDRKSIDQKISEIDKKINAINNEIKSLTAKDPVISEHALLRYFQRVEQFDINDIKKKILSESVVKKIKTLGSAQIPIDIEKDLTVTLIVKDNVVVTLK